MARGIPGSGNSKYGITIAANVKGQDKIKALGNSMQGLQGRAKNLAGAFKGLLGPLVAIGGAAVAVQTLRKSFDVLAEREADFATLANGLTRVSTDAPKAAKALRGLADDLGFATLFDEKAFQKGFALLTSFKNIGLDSYGRVAETAADLAQINQVDLKSSFLQLAKALSDPTRGLTALSRSGVIFTEQQREMILELHNSGQEMKAQAEILRIVEGSYKGAARAAAEGLAGALDTLGQRFRDFQELLGTALAPILVPLLEATEELVINLTNAIRVMLLNIPTLIENLKIVLLVTKVWASTLIGIAAGKFFVALLANFAKIVKITKTLLTLEKIKLGYMKAQAAITALLSSPKNLAGVIAGAGAAVAIYASLDKFIKNTVDSIEDNFSKLGNDLDFQASLLKGLDGTKTDLTEINNLLKSIGISAGGVNESLTSAFGQKGKKKLDAFEKSLTDVGSKMADVVIKGFKGMENALTEFVLSGKLSFKSLADSIIKDMIRIAIQQTIMAPFTSWFGGLFSGGANKGPSIQPAPKLARAMGGPVTAGKDYLVGERGPEIFTPSSSGHITPNNQVGNISEYAKGGVIDSPKQKNNDWNRIELIKGGLNEPSKLENKPITFKNEASKIKIEPPIVNIEPSIVNVKPPIVNVEPPILNIEPSNNDSNNIVNNNHVSNLSKSNNNHVSNLSKLNNHSQVVEHVKGGIVESSNVNNNWNVMEYAKGGIVEPPKINNNWQVAKFAKGGVVIDQPHFKYMANGGIAVAGEGKGAEAILPLRRRNGILGVEGGGSNTSVVINVDAKGQQQVQGNQEQANQLGRAISQAVTAELVKQKRPGGILSAA